MVPLSMTLCNPYPDFKVTTFFDIEYLRNDTRYKRHSLFTVERQYEVICALSNSDIFNDLDGPLIGFSRSLHF